MRRAFLAGDATASTSSPGDRSVRGRTLAREEVMPAQRLLTCKTSSCVALAVSEGAD